MAANTPSADPTKEQVTFKLESWIPMLIAHIIAAIGIILILKFFVYRPFKEWSANRLKFVQKQDQKTKQALSDAEILQKKAEKKLLASKKQGIEYLNNLKIKLQTEETEMTTKLAERKQRLLQETQAQIIQMRRETKTEIQANIVKNSLILAEKILQAQIDSSEHQKIIDDFINDLNE